MITQSVGFIVKDSTNEKSTTRTLNCWEEATVVLDGMVLSRGGDGGLGIGSITREERNLVCSGSVGGVSTPPPAAGAGSIPSYTPPAASGSSGGSGDSAGSGSSGSNGDSGSSGTSGGSGYSNGEGIPGGEGSSGGNGICADCDYPSVPDGGIDFIPILDRDIVGGGGYSPEPEDTEEIIIDDSFINTKAECIYNKLLNLSGGFKNAIQKFDGEFSVSHLKFSINNNLGAYTYGVTIPPKNYITEIQMNENSLGLLSDLGKATAMIHEVIHAEIFRKMLSAAQQGDLNIGKYTTQERTSYVNSLKDNFPGLYDYYIERYKPTWNHNMMASHYRAIIADILQEFDNYRLDRSIYEAIAWMGLRNIENNETTKAWNDLSPSEKQRIQDLINQHIFNGPSICN